MNKAPKVPGWGRQPLNLKPSDALPESTIWPGLAVIAQHQARTIYTSTTHTHG